MATIRLVTTLIRDICDEVAKTLKERASTEGKSLSAYVSAELAKIAMRPTNAQIVSRLRARDRSAGPAADQILEAVKAGRR